MTRPVQQFPPVAAQGGGQLTYKPRHLADLTGLRNELPPPPNGGGPWVQKLSLTEGVLLAMGDIHAILGTSVGTAKLDQIERMANTTQVAPHVPAPDHIEAIFNAVRTIYPVSTATLAGCAHPWRGDGSVTRLGSTRQQKNGLESLEKCQEKPLPPW